MQSNFVATISRRSRDKIESETHGSQLEALRDLLGNWDDNRDEGFDTVASSIYDEMDNGAVDEIVEKMLADMDNEWLIARLKAAKVDLDELKEELS